MYEYMGEMKEAEIVVEEIPVRGRDEPERLEIRLTHHGPVVSDVVQLHQGRALSLRWTALEPTREADMLLQLAYGRRCLSCTTHRRD